MTNSNRWIESIDLDLFKVTKLKNSKLEYPFMREIGREEGNKNNKKLISHFYPFVIIYYI